jgi:hypothetical protein
MVTREIDNKITLIANARRLLQDFWKWSHAAGFPYWDFSHSDDYRLKLFEVPDRSEYLHHLKDFQIDAPYIVNDIMTVVNNMKRMELRGFLVIYYLKPPDFYPFEHQKKGRIKPVWRNVCKQLGLKTSTKKGDIEEQTLLEFAERFRDGWLIEYTREHGEALGQKG